MTRASLPRTALLVLLLAGLLPGVTGHAMSSGGKELSVGDIEDWPAFIEALKPSADSAIRKLLPQSARDSIAGFGDTLSKDDKDYLVGVLNEHVIDKDTGYTVAFVKAMGSAPAADLNGEQQTSSDEPVPVLPFEYLSEALLGAILIAIVVATVFQLRTQARARRVLDEMAGQLHRVAADLDRITDLLRGQSVRGPAETRSSGIQELKPEFSRLAEIQGEGVSAMQTIQAGLEQLRTEVTRQPKQVAQELDQLQTARELRAKEESKLAFIAEMRQALTGLTQADPPLLAIARLTDRMLTFAGKEGDELNTRLDPFVKVARRHEDIERRLKELRVASGPEVRAMQGGITDSIAELGHEAKRLQLKLPIFQSLLDLAGRIPGRTADRQELMRLLGVAEVMPRRGEAVTNREQYEIARDLGQGRQMVIESVELCGYRDVRNNTTLRKPRVVVQRRAEA